MLEAELVFINTGCRPAAPDVEGLDRVPSLDSTSIMELDEVPEHLLVLGGGYIGLEFGQMFRRFGSRVTIVQRGGQLLPLEDADVAEAVLGVLREDGIEVLLEAEAVRAEASDGGSPADRPDTGRRAVASRDRTSSGPPGGCRTPTAWRLEAAGIATDAKGFVVVDQQLETSGRGVYALGDVKGGPAFTHISYDDFRVIRTNLLQGGRACITDRLATLHRIHRPAIGPHRTEREREARKQGRALPGGPDADEPRRPGARARRGPRVHEGAGGPGRRARSWAPRCWASRAAS